MCVLQVYLIWMHIWISMFYQHPVAQSVKLSICCVCSNVSKHTYTHICVILHYNKVNDCVNFALVFPYPTYYLPIPYINLYHSVHSVYSSGLFWSIYCPFCFIVVFLFCVVLFLRTIQSRHIRF